VEYAFTPLDPDRCTQGSTDIDAGLFYREECAADRRYKPYSAALLLWADTDAVKNDMVARKYQESGYWKNGDDVVVGTRYVLEEFGSVQHVYCYDTIPLCLAVDQAYAREEFGSLSVGQIDNVAAWLKTHPVADPTARWDTGAAERAFPAASGFHPLACSPQNLSPDPSKGFGCRWPDDRSAVISEWPTAHEAIETYSKSDVAEPWMVNGVERGTVFTGEDLGDAKRWCYVDAPYCIRINDSPDDTMARIAPLTADQAANLRRH